jgi:hypothetical protein
MLHITRTGSKGFGQILRLCLATIVLVTLSWPALAMPLSNGDKTSGAISTASEQDSFTFSAAVGDHVVLRIVDTSGSDFVPRIELYDPSGTLVRAERGPVVSSVEHNIGQAGEYTVLVRDDSTNSSNDLQTGSYDLYFVKVPDANEQGELANDSVNAGTIDLGDLDTYTFSANAGEHIVLRIVDTSGDADFVPRIELYDPSGTLVGAERGPTVSTVEHNASATGTFTVLIKDDRTNSGNDFGTGNYNLYFVKVPDANEQGELANDSVNAGTIDLGDLDTYTFSANAGEHIVLRIVDTSGDENFVPRIELYDPSGTLVGAERGPAVSTVEHNASATGTFTVLIKDDRTNSGNDFGVGNYNLYFVNVPEANELGTLVSGVDKTETIDLGDLDTYVFDASAGADIALEIEDLSSDANFVPRIELYGPDGTLLGAARGQDIASTTVKSTQSGTHTVLVKDDRTNSGNDFGAGDYILRFDIDPPPTGGTYPIGIRPPTELNLNDMEVIEGKFILTNVIGYSASNQGSELLLAPIEIDATIGNGAFHKLLDVPVEFEVLNLIGRFESTSPAKPPIRFDYIMGPVALTGPGANTISLPLFTDDFFYQITNLSTGEDVFVDGDDPKPDISLTPLAQSLAVVTRTNTWYIGYPAQTTLRTPQPGQPHGTLGTPSTINNSPVNLNNAPTVEDADITVTRGETITHTFIGTDPENESLTWRFIDITGTNVGVQPIFDPDTQLLTWDTTGSTSPGTFVIRVSAVDPGNQGDIGTLTVTIMDNPPGTYTIGISPPAELNLDDMEISEGTFNLTSVIGYSESNSAGVELLGAPVNVDAMIGSGIFHALLDVPSDVEVLNLIGFFEATSPVKPLVRFDYIMGPIETVGPDANTISLPLFTSNFFYQVTDLISGEDIFIDGGDPKPVVSLNPLSQVLAIFNGTNTWNVGYPSQTTLGTPQPGQPHGTLGTPSSIDDTPVNRNNAPNVEDATISVVQGETVTHTFSGVDPDGDSLTWRFIGISGSNIGAQPTFDPNSQLLTWDTTGSVAPGSFSIRVSAVDIGNLGDFGTLTVNVTTPVVSIPSVVARHQAGAEDTIVSAGLTVGSVTMTNHDNVPAGSVISQDPAAGAPIASGSPIALVVSTGPSSSAQCDVNADGAIDRFDIGLIFVARNTPATNTAMDADGDGIVTVNDGRLCVLQCTNARCVP